MSTKDKRVLRKPDQITIREGRDGGASVTASIESAGFCGITVYQRFYDKVEVARATARELIDGEFSVPEPHVDDDEDTF